MLFGAKDINSEEEDEARQVLLQEVALLHVLGQLSPSSAKYSAKTNFPSGREEDKKSIKRKKGEIGLQRKERLVSNRKKRTFEL